MSANWVEMILRLVLATVFGGLVGYQRERAEKPAGLRTHVLVCLGSALIMQLSFYPFKEIARVDPTRIAAGVVIGIGFLGAGTIIRQGSTVHGLTTAASVWVTAGVGLAIGIGFYVPAVATTALIIMVLTALKQIEVHMIGDNKIIELVSKDTPGQLGKIGVVLGESGVNIRNIEINCAEDTGLCNVRLQVEQPPNISASNIIDKLSSIPGITRAAFEK
jgi:putative Mg2+ transporter-C (MgtC) family protein